MGTKWNGIDRNKKPRQISKKKLTKLPEENKVRQMVKERAGNRCEICWEFGATPPTYKMEIHELVFRSAGGEISPNNSFQIDGICHFILQHHLINFKERCIIMIISGRNASDPRALRIYNKIYEFADKHGLIRESKIKVE